MVIIKVNAYMEPDRLARITKVIYEQAANGVIVLPHYCELLNEVPADETIKVVCEQEPDSEKERDAKEFARRVKEKMCKTCKERHAPPAQSSCWACSAGNLYRKE